MHIKIIILWHYCSTSVMHLFMQGLATIRLTLAFMIRKIGFGSLSPTWSIYYNNMLIHFNNKLPSCITLKSTPKPINKIKIYTENFKSTNSSLKLKAFNTHFNFIKYNHSRLRIVYSFHWSRMRTIFREICMLSISLHMISIS